MLTSRLCFALALAGALLGSGAACSYPVDNSPGVEAPVPPAMPAGFHTLKDEQLRGAALGAGAERVSVPLKAMRVTSYEANGHRLQLTTYVVATAEVADSLYRILAHNKTPYAVARRGDVIFELGGPLESTEEIKLAHEALAP